MIPLTKDKKGKNKEKGKDKLSDIGKFGNLTPKFCENCGTAYSDGDARIVHENPVATVILFHCSNCNSSYLVNVIKPAGVASRVGINTDLDNYEEIGRYIGKHVTADNVIDFYNFTENLENPDDLFDDIRKFLEDQSK